jgi:hypothetical protein
MEEKLEIMVCYEKKLTAGVSTLALEPLDTSSAGGRHLCQRSRFQSIQITISSYRTMHDVV